MSLTLMFPRGLGTALFVQNAREPRVKATEGFGGLDADADERDLHRAIAADGMTQPVVVLHRQDLLGLLAGQEA